jgi:hypothetical protein
MSTFEHCLSLSSLIINLEWNLMDSAREQDKIAFISCIEVIIMRKNGAKYHLVEAKLNALYNCKISDCYEHPEYLRTVLKEVYKEDYNSLIEEIKELASGLVDIDKQKAHFFKVMES